jgi:tetratricopeptide (TPR) repeat protein
VLRWFAYPQALTLLLALPLLANLVLLAWLARRRGWRLLGSLPALAALSSRLPRRRLMRGLLLGVGLLFVGVAAAGPQWGRDQAAISSAARDLVVVLDVSRSMLAETPSRQVRAQRVLADLATTLKQRGGHRVALVVGAAKAQLVVPLTTDYDLFHEAVMAQDAARLPAELRPGPNSTSGTRLGEMIQQAIAAHDAKYHGSQVILLVSDGDDPAEDGEWKDGATAARRAGIPVFTVGVGDPDKPSKIRIGEALLKYNDQPVESKLQEEPLKEIARRTDGTYFAVRTDNVAPGTLFPALLEAAAARPREAPALTTPQQHYRWFLGAGLLCLVGSLCIGDRRKVHEAKAAPRLVPLGLAAAVAFIAVVLTGAAPEAEDWLRQANDAFQKKDYEAALRFYEKAEDRAADPGLVAFNKGATLLRLGRHREAELCYLRCLQDHDCPASRRLKALYDLGTALLQRGADAKDADALLRAGECFELCHKEATADKALRDDAEYNLELARLLWMKVRQEAKDDQKNPGDGDPKKQDTKKNNTDKGGDPTRDPDGSGDKTPGDGKSAESNKKVPGPGTVQTLPDTDKLQSMDGHDARDLLARVIDRIERDRNQALGQQKTENGNVKDW